MRCKTARMGNGRNSDPAVPRYVSCPGAVKLVLRGTPGGTGGETGRCSCVCSGANSRRCRPRWSTFRSASWTAGREEKPPIDGCEVWRGAVISAPPTSSPLVSHHQLLDRQSDAIPAHTFVRGRCSLGEAGYHRYLQPSASARCREGCGITVYAV